MSRSLEDICIDLMNENESKDDIIDSLKKEVENKEALYDLQMKKYHEADSIAEALATKNFGERERY